MENTTEYRFVCPDCTESLTVDEPMKGALVEYGCVVCSYPATASAFSTA